jgi:uncharacterized protein DUF2321
VAARAEVAAVRFVDPFPSSRRVLVLTDVLRYGPDLMSSGEYMPGAVCRRGHPISDDVTRHPASQNCEQCGAEVLTACPECRQSIRGYYRIPGASYAEAFFSS